ncbi:unnamed protein product, partial [Ilex paraguariensis]
MERVKCGANDPSTLPLSTIKACFNLSRTAQAIYEHGHDNRAPRSKIMQTLYSPSRLFYRLLVQIIESAICCVRIITA